MGLTQVSKDGVKNDAIDASKLPANSVGASELADNAVDTNAIADQAVALSKLPHGDGSSDGKFLRANNGADPSFESLPASGVTVSNNSNNRVATCDGTNLNGEANLLFDGTELSIADGGGLRTNYIRPKNGNNNTGNASQQFYKLGEISLNGSEGAEITLYGQEGYSSSNLQYYGKTTIVLRGSNGSTLNGSWWSEGGESTHYYDVRWKHISGVNYELWVLAGPYNNIMPFVNTTGTFSQSNAGGTGSNSAPNGSTQLQYNSFKLVKNVATIQYTNTHTRFLQNIKLDSGKGIDFSATSNSSGSMGSELLNDYEEGTWTPTINVGTFTTFLTNRYIKIGRLVHLHGGLIFHNNSSNTRVEISSIPFAQQSSGQYVGNVWLRRTSTGERNWNCIIGEAGQNIIGVFRDSNGNDMGGELKYSDFQHSSTYFNYSITYISAS